MVITLGLKYLMTIPFSITQTHTLNKFSLVQTRFAGFTKKTNEDGEKASDQQKAKEDAREQAKKASGGSSMIPIIAGLLLLGGGTVSITS
jgi:hypothetical protein